METNTFSVTDIIAINIFNRIIYFKKDWFNNKEIKKGNYTISEILTLLSEMDNKTIINKKRNRIYKIIENEFTSNRTDFNITIDYKVKIEINDTLSFFDKKIFNGVNYENYSLMEIISRIHCYLWEHQHEENTQLIFELNDICNTINSCFEKK